jgi:hypothetical protein
MAVPPWLPGRFSVKLSAGSEISEIRSEESPSGLARSWSWSAGAAESAVGRRERDAGDHALACQPVGRERSSKREPQQVESEHVAAVRPPFQRRERVLAAAVPDGVRRDSRGVERDRAGQGLERQLAQRQAVGAAGAAGNLGDRPPVELVLHVAVPPADRHGDQDHRESDSSDERGWPAKERGRGTSHGLPSLPCFIRARPPDPSEPYRRGRIGATKSRNADEVLDSRGRERAGAVHGHVRVTAETIDGNRPS